MSNRSPTENGTALDRILREQAECCEARASELEDVGTAGSAATSSAAGNGPWFAETA